MAMKFEIQINKRTTVKPSSPTTENCRRYELSLLDQLMPNIPIPVLLFYPSTTRILSISEASRLLEKSLSQALTRFYHFSGRLINNVSIECNDDGVEFETTRVSCSLSTVLSNPDSGVLADFAPSQTFSKGELLRVKASFFDCGGLTIGVCFSHKVGDACTMSMFLNYWAAVASTRELQPAFIPQVVSSASIFPPLDTLASFADLYKAPDEDNEKIEGRRLVFSSPRIEALKLEAASDSKVQNPTRVEAVSALIWKCATEALLFVSNTSTSDERTSSFTQSMNIRKRMNPCLPENSVGNLVWIFQSKIPSSNKGDRTELKDLVVLLREGIEEASATWKKGITSEALGSVIERMSRPKNDDADLQFVSSSWCRFPLYEADFGWGKPAWLFSPIQEKMKNVWGMMDTRDGEGIEVTLALAEEAMKHFETSPELLAFASLNPAVII